MRESLLGLAAVVWLGFALALWTGPLVPALVVWLLE